MEKKEFEDYLESIGGLENGFFSDRPRIKNASFFQFDSGWYSLVRNLIDELIAAGWDRQLCQAKEKFGGLRFYINSASDECYEIISKYEKLSYEVCEKCGEPGSIRNGSWIFTLCDKHNEERNNEARK